MSRRVVAVLPARDEAERLPAVVAGLRPRVERIIVVDDASRDGTAAMARAEGCDVFERVVPGGVGAATWSGLQAACAMGAEITVTIDADGQHDPVWLDRALEIIELQDADVVLADRFRTVRGVPVTKRLANNLGWAFVRRSLGRDPVTRDVSCGFRVYGKRGLRRVLEQPGTRDLGYAFVQATYEWLHRGPLRLASIGVPALYPVPCGTPIGELRQFLNWAGMRPRTGSLARALLRRIQERGAFTTRIASWVQPYPTITIRALRSGDEVFFSRVRGTRACRCTT